MARAAIKTREGTKIQVEGSPEEIAKIMSLYRDSDYIAESKKDFRKFIKKTSSPSVPDMIRELAAEGYLDKPKGLAEIKTALEEQGHFIPMTTLSARVLGLTKRKEIRRLKEEGKWKYVKR